MLEKVKEYFETELRQAEITTERPWADISEVVWYSIQRCLGVANFVIGHCDIPFEMVDPLFEEYKEKLEKLLTKRFVYDIM